MTTATEPRPPGDVIGLTVNGVTRGYIATDMLATIPDRLMARLPAQDRARRPPLLLCLPSVPLDPRTERLIKLA